VKKRVLSFGAHPDDIEIGCGGTEAILVRQGFEVSHAILTSGEAGSRHMSPSDLACQREAEARASARILGARHVGFLHYPDGLTHYTREMKVDVIRLIRKIQPDTVFVHTREDQFPDHRITHDLVMAALEGASGPWYPEVIEEPHTVANVFGYEVWTPIAKPQTFIEISTVIQQKIEALKAHESQLKDTSYDKAILGLACYRGVMGRKGSHAEAFEVIRREEFAC
jgi:LmbE family N-acetylglucosaminyl deacetylase